MSAEQVKKMMSMITKILNTNSFSMTCNSVPTLLHTELHIRVIYVCIYVHICMLYTCVYIIHTCVYIYKILKFFYFPPTAPGDSTLLLLILTTTTVEMIII